MMVDELDEARKCIRELTALSLLPAIWSEGNSEYFSDSLADSLQNSLRADILYIQCQLESGNRSTAIRSFENNDNILGSLETAIEQALSRDGNDYVDFLLQDRTIRLAVIPLGACREFGVLAIGSQRADFPTAYERILLNFSVNQAIIAFRSARQLIALRRNEANLRDFIENATIGLHWVDQDGIIIWANKAELEMLGYSTDEYIGHHITEFHADRYIISDILCRLSDGETIQDYEAQLLCKDGSLRTVLINSNALFEDGRFIHTQWFMRDISARKKAEQDLKEISEHRRLAMEIGDLGSWDYKFDIGTIFWDERCRNMWGLSEGSSLEFESVMEIIHEEDRERIMSAVVAALKGINSGDYRVEFRVRWPDASVHWISSRGQVYLDEKEQKPLRFIGTDRDITEQKDAEEALREADRRKNEFLAILSHELRGPMAPIFNALQLLNQEGNKHGVESEARDVIERQMKHLAKLVEDLLDVSRITTGKIKLKIESIDLKILLERAVERLKPQFQSLRQNIHLTLPNEPVFINADTTRLEQIFGNLLHNASKYNREGGHIWITVYQQENSIVINVGDNGIGIDPELLPKIFQLFTSMETSLDRPDSGLGIGLALVKKLVELHQGTIEVFSKGIGQGSEFSVRLPIASTRPIEVNKQIHYTSSTAPLKILLVDDNKDTTTMSAMMLKSWGHKVRMAHSGQEALQRAKSFLPDMVLMDIGMPGMDGYEVARLMRQDPSFNKVTLIAITGYGQSVDRRISIEAGFDLHLAKPVEPIELKKYISQYARKK